MKISFIILLLWAIFFYITKACDIDMPNILLAVQFEGRGALGTQESTEFLVPLYSDCNYASSASPVQASGSVPTTAVSAYFPGDAFGFSGSDGLLLHSDALNSFLQSLSSIVGSSIDVNAALSLVICIVTTSDGTQFRFTDISTYVFEAGALVSIISYQCTVVLGA